MIVLKMKTSLPMILLTLAALLAQYETLALQEACGMAEKADILFLVDESWSIGESNFQRIKDFIYNVIRTFENVMVGKAGVRLGVVLYGDKPRISIDLTDYITIAEVLVAVRDLFFEGGNARTGSAFSFLLDTMIITGALRGDAAKVVILITDGKSSDPVDEPAALLKDAGVTVFTVGIKNADRNELRRIASDPVEEHMLYVEDFHQLSSLSQKLSRRLCFTASEPPQPAKQRAKVEKIIKPRDLIVSEQSYNSLRLTWTPATGKVTGYHILFDSLSTADQNAPEDQRQIVLDASKSTVLVTDLKPNTKYFFTVLAVYADVLGEPATVKGKTTSIPPVTHFRVIEEGLSSLKVAWTPALGKLEGYKIYIPKSHKTGMTSEKILGSDVSSHLLDNLQEDKDYTISIYAVYPEGPSQPVSTTGRTYCGWTSGSSDVHAEAWSFDFLDQPMVKLLPVKNIWLQNETTNTIQVRWTQVRGASGYRLTWMSSEGSVQDVNLGETYSYYMIQGLQPGAEYTITVNPIFGATEGPIVTAKTTTLSSSAVQILKATDITINSAVVFWNSVPGATGYRVTWGPTPEFFGRDRPRQLALNSSTTAYRLQNLAHDTEYVISLYVLFGSVEGPGITITARTSPLGYVSDFKVTSRTSTSISLSWSTVPAATKYKIIWKPSGIGHERETFKNLLLGSRVRAHHLENLLPDTQYSIGIRALFGASEGKVVTLTQSTAGSRANLSIPLLTVTSEKPVTTKRQPLSSTQLTLPTATSLGPRFTAAHTARVTKTLVPSVTTPGPICSKFKADLAFLVDESSSIGQSNFLKVKDFLFRIVSYFPKIGPEGTQIAVTQYSEEPRIEFHFNQYKDRNGVLKALKRLRYAGGNTKTGRGIGYMLKEVFQASKGMRPSVPHTLVLLTDGRSQDDVLPPAQVAHIIGIRVITVGVSGADPEELKKILLHQNLENLFYVNTFDDLPQIIRELIETICFGSQQGGDLTPHNRLADKKGEVDKSEQLLDKKGELPISTSSSVPLVVQPPEGPCDLRCPKAEKGEKGDQGPPGDANFAGLHTGAGYDPFSFATKGEKGERGLPGKDGIPGLPGRPGRTGSPGSPGLMGLPGIQGDHGPPGYPGPSGPKGDRGEPGYVLGGVEVIPGQNGQPGPPGYKGQPGAPGVPGPPGLPGLPGPQGPPGLSVKGEPGDPGIRGPRGKSGIKGETGESGETGKAGLPGPIGLDGTPGAPGPKGEKGEAGVGVPGLPGLKGAEGDKGAMGPPGSQGQKGERGMTGPEGPTGLRGKKGQDGVKGEKGERGEAGLKGLQGIAGLLGPVGPKGDQGMQGFPGAPAMGVVGPTGKKGSRGDVGPVGPPGPKGESGKQGEKGVKGSPGFGIPGQLGLKGEPGERGNVGLSGKPGQKGETGPKGNKGEPGQSGKPGEPGLRGKDGEPGKKGEPGVQGEAGVPGEQGERGARGPSGLPGRPGERGMKGDPGEHGKDGAIGEKGDKGESGKPGPPGMPGETVLPLENSITIKGEKGEPGPPGKGMDIKDLESLFEAHGIKLALLKELMDLLQQEGVEMVTQHIATSRKGKGKTARKKQGSKQAMDHVSSAKCDVSSENLAGTTEVPREDLSINLEIPIPEAEETLVSPSTLPPSTIAKAVVAEQKFTTTINSNSGPSEITASHIDLGHMETIKTTENPEGKNTTEDENFLQQGGVAENATLESQEGVFPPEGLSIRKEVEGELELGPVHLDLESQYHSLENASLQMTENLKKRKTDEDPFKMPPILALEMEDNSSEHAPREVLGTMKKRQGEWKKEKEASQETTDAFANAGQTSNLRVRRMVENRNLMVRSPGALGIRETLMEYHARNGAYPGPHRSRRIKKQESDTMDGDFRPNQDQKGEKGSPGSPGSKGEKGEPGEAGKSGEKGTKGDEGDVGQKGEPGIGFRGPMGQAGSPGQKGEPGAVGGPGVQGIQGIRGNAGIPGSQGERGPPGLPGIPGQKGERGKRGRNGSVGPPGPLGPPGQEGVPGAPGTKGNKGETGLGKVGPRGPRGFPGPRGEEGIVGVRGPLGMMGQNGLVGLKGEKGDVGFPGPKGERGDPMSIFGPQGYKGNKGDSGERGPPGFDGDKGEKGEDGPAGEKGVKGEAGSKGVMGLFGTRGPVGQKGEIGEPGLPGFAGRAGLDGKNGMKGAKGDRGLQGQKGEPGGKGDPGITGDIGRKGSKGLRGLPGKTGPPGTHGIKGEIGGTGRPGTPGAGGFLGPKGERGESGTNGLQGIMGQKGEKGSKGVPGLGGFKGQIGLPGKVGVTGPPGPQGPQGEPGPQGEQGRRGRQQLCLRGAPGTPGNKGGKGEGGSTGRKGEKGDPGLSAEEVKDIVRTEMKDQDGKNFHSANRLADLGADYLADVEPRAERALLPKGLMEQEFFSGVQNRTKADLLLTESVPPLADPCILPMDEGACKRYTVLWYYHQEANNCRPFIFGGCGGNANQFPSKRKCELWCKRVAGSSQNVDQARGERDSENTQKSAISKTVHSANGMV